MTITITIQTDNAAFEDDFVGEVEGILDDCIAYVHQAETYRSLRDSNGNTVGSFHYKDV